MPHRRQSVDQPSDDHRPHTRHADTESGSPYGFLDYNEPGESSHRGRSSSPRQSPRRDEVQGYRRRSRDRSYSRSLSPEYRRRRPNPEPRREQETQRGRRGASDRWRPARSPYRHHNAGYTITDHNQGKSFNCGPEYFMKPEVLQDVTGRYGPGDVVSVRHSDFSYDNQAEIGARFTLSSEGRLYIEKDVPFILFKVEPGYGIGWLGRSASSRGLRGMHWIPESDYPKYMGVATQGDLAGPAGNDSPHDQLQVVPVVGSERLYPTTHIFVSELVKVPIPRIHKQWGRLGFDSYYRLVCLMNFLTAGPLSLNASPDSIPKDIGLDIGALRTLRSANDCLVGDWAERLAAYADSHPLNSASTQSRVDSPQAQARPQQARARPQLQAPSKESRPPPAVRSVPGNQESKNSSPMPGPNRATNKVGQPPATPNTSSHRATQAPKAPGATARDEAQSDPQADIRQAHVVDASAKGGVASAIGSTRDIDAGVYNASVHNEQHNLFRVESGESSGSEEGEILE